MKRVRLDSAWSSRDFRALWRASAVSVTGTEIGDIALPVLALVALQASPAELSIVRAAQLLPFLVLPLALGVLVERRPQRRLMVQADLGRGLVLLLVAGLALTGALTVPSLSPLSPSSVPALSSTAWPTSPTFHGC
jgi:membrane protease YdiL (CAAX protease family)